MGQGLYVTPALGGPANKMAGGVPRPTSSQEFSFAFSPLGVEQATGTLRINPTPPDARWVLTGADGFEIEDQGAMTMRVPAGA